MELEELAEGQPDRELRLAEEDLLAPDDPTPAWVDAYEW